jgi:hypothetical protein
MTRDERIALAMAKVERAKKHLADLKATIAAFSDSKQYSLSQQNPILKRASWSTPSAQLGKPPPDLPAPECTEVLPNV